MIQEFPAYGLPLPKEVFDLEELPSTIRTAMQSGRARQRIKYRHNLKYVNVKWVFSKEQYLLWRMFHAEGISNGADYFTMDLLIDDVLDNFKTRIVEGTYKAEKSDPKWVVSATIELENIEIPKYEGLFSIYEAIQGDTENLLAGEDRLHILVHTTLPSYL